MSKRSSEGAQSRFRLFRRCDEDSDLSNDFSHARQTLLTKIDFSFAHDFALKVFAGLIERVE